MSKKSQITERQKVEQYLKEYCIVEYIDEILNKVLLDRPKNPYIQLAENLKSKVFPEVFSIRLENVYDNGLYGVKAIAETSLGTFFSCVNYVRNTVDVQKPLQPTPFNGLGGAGKDDKKNDKNKKGATTVEVDPESQYVSENLNQQRDFSVINMKLEEILVPLKEFKDIRKVDDILINQIANLKKEESLAISMTYCKIAAAFNGQHLYEFIAELCWKEEESDQLNLTASSTPKAFTLSSYLSIPVPSLTILSRTNNRFITQSVHISPYKTSTLEGAVEALHRLNNTFVHFDKVNKPARMTRKGTLVMDNMNTFDELYKSIYNYLITKDALSNIKLGIIFHGSRFSQKSDGAIDTKKNAKDSKKKDTGAASGASGSSFSYATETGQDKPTNDFIDSNIINLFKDTPFFSIDSPLADQDIAGLRQLKKKLTEIVLNQSSFLDGKLPDIVMDSLSFEQYQTQIEKYQDELPINSIKVSINLYPTISSILSTIKNIKKLRYKLIIDASCNNYPYFWFPDRCFEVQTFSTESFDVDLSVAVGANSWLGDGFYSASLSSRGIERFLDIVNNNSKIPLVNDFY